MAIKNATSAYSKRPFYKRGKAWLALLALAAVVLAVLEITDTTHFFHTKKAVSGTIPTASTSKGKKLVGKTSSNNSGASVPSSDLITTKYSASTAGPLVEPTGTFVSNHRVSLSASPDQKKEQSTCNTTPGASCYIRIVKSSVTRTLAAQTADSTGAVIWSWDIDNSGLTEGSWEVTAVATLNGQTKTATDPIRLEVRP